MPKRKFAEDEDSVIIMPKSTGTKKHKKSKKKSKTMRFRPQRMLSTGFPKTTMVTLRYVDTVSINPGLATVGTHHFRANSCFDPDATGIGHQPLGYDQWNVFYNHYTVVGSMCTATFGKDNTTSQGGMLVYGIDLSDDSTTSNSLTHLMEQPLTKARKTTANTGASQAVTVKRGFSCKKFFNLTNPMDATARIGATIVANPSEEAYYHVWAGNSSSSENDPGISVLVEIEYTVIFSEPRELAQS